MIQYKTTLQKFGQQGEKTGWTYIEVPAAIAEQLKPGCRKSFRVCGKLDDFEIKGAALMPMGGGDFILAVNAEMRRGIGKRKGAGIVVQMEAEEAPAQLSADLLACLDDEPAAKSFYSSLSPGHQRYFSNWIEAAKTEGTRAKRIALSLNALARGLHFGLMIREQKAGRV